MRRRGGGQGDAVDPLISIQVQIMNATLLLLGRL